MHRNRANKLETPVLVIGFQEEDHRMYPHLYDFLQNLRTVCDNVIYTGDGDQGEGLYRIDRDIRYVLEVFNPRIMSHKFHVFFTWLSSYFRRRRPLTGKNKDADLPPDGDSTDTIDLESLFLSGQFLVRNRFYSLFLSILSYYKNQRRLRKKLRDARAKYDFGLVLAIDHTSCAIAESYFPGKVVFWSFDILTGDYPTRIKNGFLEKLITSRKALRAKALIIQDEQRRRLLEQAVQSAFPDTIYLPVSLNDSEFCREASENRQKKKSFSTVNIVQSGHISQGRRSTELIGAYQHWPEHYRLSLRGFIHPDVRSRLSTAVRKPDVSEDIHDNAHLPRILDKHDIGFIGYLEDDTNHRYMENASSQTVEFLRLGIPVISCASPEFNDFVSTQGIGLGVSSVGEAGDAIKKIIDNYSSFSINARRLFESRFNLSSHFDNYLVQSLQDLL